MTQAHIQLHYHIVSTTKHRIRVLTPSIQPRLYGYIGGIIRNRGCALIAAGGIADHIHLLVSLSTQVAISDVLRDIKANSSGWLRRSFPSCRHFRWQDGYAAFTVGYAGLVSTKRYIANQEEHHRLEPFREEYMALLAENGIEN